MNAVPLAAGAGTVLSGSGFGAAHAKESVLDVGGPFRKALTRDKVILSNPAILMPMMRTHPLVVAARDEADNALSCCRNRVNAGDNFISELPDLGKVAQFLDCQFNLVSFLQFLHPGKISDACKPPVGK